MIGKVNSVAAIGIRKEPGHRFALLHSQPMIVWKRLRVRRNAGVLVAIVGRARRRGGIDGRGPPELHQLGVHVVRFLSDPHEMVESVFLVDVAPRVKRRPDEPDYDLETVGNGGVERE